MAVHYAGDYGDDAAAGAKLAAEKLGLTFTDVKTDSGADKQAGAIAAIVTEQARPGDPHHRPDRAGRDRRPGRRRAASQGRFIGTSPTWNPALLQSPAAPALTALYEQSAPWAPWAHRHARATRRCARRCRA